MSLRDFSRVPYLPILEVRPAELRSLEELPEKDKDRLLPLFKLRPWVAATKLSAAVQRIKEAYGDRPCFLALGDIEAVSKRRDVHDELDGLRESHGGYEAWCEYIESDGHEQFMPALVLEDPTQFERQAQRLHGLNRGVAILIEEPAFGFLEDFARRAARHTNGGENVVFVLDYGRQNLAMAAKANAFVNTAKAVTTAAPNSVISISASTFPDTFTSITQQEIYERQFFDIASRKLGFPIVYGDRGSARAEHQSGGGGLPAPRIDYPLDNEWRFFRDDQRFGAPGYQAQAIRLMNDPVWDSRLKVWGTQMIERTALGEDTAITSPNRSTAARINIHLHRQLHYGNQTALYDTDEEWTD